NADADRVAGLELPRRLSPHQIAKAINMSAKVPPMAAPATTAGEMGADALPASEVVVEGKATEEGVEIELEELAEAPPPVRVEAPPGSTPNTGSATSDARSWRPHALPALSNCAVVKMLVHCRSAYSERVNAVMSNLSARTNPAPPLRATHVFAGISDTDSSADASQFVFVAAKRDTATS
ncbi:hypothetical protein HDU81_005014, partial [Chytriomyces hyalinus]